MADGQAVAAAAEDRAPPRAPRRPAGAELCRGRTGNALFVVLDSYQTVEPGGAAR
jgi:hypothetical protein